jgi:hypothetical protein
MTQPRLKPCIPGHKTTALALLQPTWNYGNDGKNNDSRYNDIKWAIKGGLDLFRPEFDWTFKLQYNDDPIHYMVSGSAT